MDIFVDLRLQNGQVELILRSMELYGYNLKFMVNDTDITTEERSRKQAKLEYTYQQILTTQAEQVNNKANLHNLIKNGGVGGRVLFSDIYNLNKY